MVYYILQQSCAQLTDELGDICCKSTDALDLNDGTANDISDEESKHRSGDSCNGFLRNKERLRDIDAIEEMAQKEINLIQNCSCPTQNGVVDLIIADERESPSRRDSMPKTKTVLKDQTSELGDGTRLDNNRGGGGNTKAQKVSSGLDDSNVTDSETVRCEQMDRTSPKDVKRKGFHQEHSCHVDSNSRKNECEDRHFSRINNAAATTTTSSRYVRGRVEGFRGREKRFNDRCISSRYPRSESQVFVRNDHHSHIFPKRAKFAEDGHNFVHRRHGIDARDARKRDRYGYGAKRRSYGGKSRDDHESTSQRSSPSAHREKPHGPRKRLKKSSSPPSHEDGKKLHRNIDGSDLENSPTQGHCDGRFNRRFGGSSGLGGYSPRRRRSEAAVKTPSPPPRSPIRLKTRAWDMVPAGIDSKVVAALAAAHTAQQQQQQQVSMAPLVPMSVMTAPHKLNAAAAVAAAAAAASQSHLSAMLPSLLLQQQQQVQQQVNGVSGSGGGSGGGGLSTVTLTQATRSIRRLYVGNVPSTVSDGELMEFMNAAMLSANAHHIPGTKPCINCIVNIEKAYAFAEFITPEDATTALGFDGVTLHGTILKIRRPKDFIAPEHGGCPIAQPVINLVGDVVLDSPHKVFVGGISSLLTPDKVKEIITAFGQLKSFHWKTMHHNNGGCSIAFFEYLDPTVTHQACKGLNGMNLGGQVLTVLQATPDAKYEVFSKNPPFYDIPEEALPLLETPTNVLEIHNLVSEEEVLHMQDKDVRKLMEDVRIECKRFGNIRSIQIVKPSIPQVCKTIDQKEEKILMGTNGEPSNNEEESNIPTIAITNETCELKDMERIPQSIANNCGNDVEDSTNKEINNMEEIKLEDGCKDVDCNTKEEIEKQPLLQISTSISSSLNPNNLLGSNTCKMSRMEPLKAGNIYVEYSRDESACHAAHALHGRGYGNAKVSVAFVSPRFYLKHFGRESAAV
ncbi:uncharacterized protein [Physcomitrium patens]|uniref:uncharacterized protein isoform X3 n=1 Tax=Physcomitrium patens TaxID=3218 RepID=UPI003CCE018C